MKVRTARLLMRFMPILTVSFFLTACPQGRAPSEKVQKPRTDTYTQDSLNSAATNTVLANMTPPPPVISDVSSDAFATELTRAGKPVLAFFYSPESAPCSWIRPRLKSVVASYTNDISCIAVNLKTTGGSALEAQYNIISVPAFLFFRETKEQSRLMGLPSRERFNYVIKTHLLQEKAL